MTTTKRYKRLVFFAFGQSHMASLTNLTLHCWFCEEQTKRTSPKIANATDISMFKAGKCCHTTLNTPDLPEFVYLRAHPERDCHDIKPFRMHCKTCNNQLGVVIRAGGKLRPSFQQFSVIFRNENGKSVHVQAWKNEYAKTHLVVPIEKLGESTYFGADEARFYVLDHKVWEKNKITSPRIQKDMTPEEPKIFEFKLHEDKVQYTISGVATTAKKGGGKETTNARPIETIQKSWKDIKPAPKKFSSGKPVQIESSTHNITSSNPFSLLLQ